jgi:hypothetical protein
MVLQGVESSIMDAHSTVRPTAKEPLDEGFGFVRETGFASLLGSCGLVFDYGYLVFSLCGIKLIQ